jgi:hypothetical protein
VSKFKKFLRTFSAGHLAVVLIRGDCVYLGSFPGNSRVQVLLFLKQFIPGKSLKINNWLFSYFSLLQTGYFDNIALKKIHNGGPSKLQHQEPPGPP